MTETVQAEITPAHRWTNGGERVRILKCCDAKGKGYGGFEWPEKGPVTPPHWSREPTCESGGLFGWAWGLAFGDGKEPDFGGLWVVFEAHPDDVIDLGGKVKAVPNPDAGRTPEVIFRGAYHQANQRVLDGQVAWVRHASRGAASATGDNGAASATASRGAASATGGNGAASATGYRGAASATGDSGAASATGYSGAASATGKKSVAAVTGELATVEAGPGGVAVAVAEECWWRVHADALFLQRWAVGHRFAWAADLGAATGDRVRFVRGEAVEHVRAG